MTKEVKNMAAIATPKSAKMALYMPWGTDPDTGKTVTKSITINGLATNAQPTPIMNVVDLISPCMEHTVGEVDFTVVQTIEKE